MRSSCDHSPLPRCCGFVDVTRERIDQRDAGVGAHTFDRDLVGVAGENLDATGVNPLG